MIAGGGVVSDNPSIVNDSLLAISASTWLSHSKLEALDWSSPPFKGVNINGNDTLAKHA